MAEVCRALEVSFRHLPEPARKVFGPDPVTVDGVEFPVVGRLVIAQDQLPSWGVDGPRGFRFLYVPGPSEWATLWASSLANVPVRLLRFYRAAGESEWVEQTKWRFEGVVTDAVVQSTEQATLQCEAKPWSRTLLARPTVDEWTADSLPGFSVMRGTNELLEVVKA